MSPVHKADVTFWYCAAFFTVVATIWGDNHAVIKPPENQFPGYLKYTKLFVFDTGAVRYCCCNDSDINLNLCGFFRKKTP